MENILFIRTGSSWRAASPTTEPPSWANLRPSLSAAPVSLASSFPVWAWVTPWLPFGVPFYRKRLFFRSQNRFPAFPPGTASTWRPSTGANLMTPPGHPRRGAGRLPAQGAGGVSGHPYRRRRVSSPSWGNHPGRGSSLVLLAPGPFFAKGGGPSGHLLPGRPTLFRAEVAPGRIRCHPRTGSRFTQRKTKTTFHNLACP